jgi:hypothetical protein
MARRTFTRLFLHLEHPLRDFLNPSRLDIAFGAEALLGGEGSMVLMMVSVVDCEVEGARGW